MRKLGTGSRKFIVFETQSIRKVVKRNSEYTSVTTVVSGIFHPRLRMRLIWCEVFLEKRMDEYKSATDLFGSYRFLPKKKGSERGMLMEYFAEKTGKPLKYIAFRLAGIPTYDLYHIKKQCDIYKGPWTKAFYGMLKVKQ